MVSPCRTLCQLTGRNSTRPTVLLSSLELKWLLMRARAALRNSFTEKRKEVNLNQCCIIRVTVSCAFWFSVKQHDSSSTTFIYAHFLDLFMYSEKMCSFKHWAPQHSINKRPNFFLSNWPSVLSKQHIFKLTNCWTNCLNDRLKKPSHERQRI